MLADRVNRDFFLPFAPVPLKQAKPFAFVLRFESFTFALVRSWFSNRFNSPVPQIQLSLTGISVRLRPVLSRLNTTAFFLETLSKITKDGGCVIYRNLTNI